MLTNKSILLFSVAFRERLYTCINIETRSTNNVSTNFTSACLGSTSKQTALADRGVNQPDAINDTTTVISTTFRPLYPQLGFPTPVKGETTQTCDDHSPFTVIHRPCCHRGSRSSSFSRCLFGSWPVERVDILHSWRLLLPDTDQTTGPPRTRPPRRTWRGDVTKDTLLLPLFFFFLLLPAHACTRHWAVFKKTKQSPFTCFLN